MMGLTSASGGESAAEMLKTLSDSGLFAARLKDLVNKENEAKVILEQAKAEAQRAEAQRAEVESHAKVAVEALKAQSATEQDVARREMALSAKAASLAIQEASVANQRDQFEKFKTAELANLGKESDALAAKISEHEKNVIAERERLDEQHKSHTEGLEAKHKARVDELNQLEKTLLGRAVSLDEREAVVKKSEEQLQLKLTRLRELSV